MRRLLLILTMAAVTAGCEMTVNVELPNREPELVVNSVVRPDSAFWVEVSNSRPVSRDIEILPVRDAVVKVIENETTEHILQLAEAGDLDGIGNVPEEKVYYRSDSLIPEIGSRYAIEVETPQYGTATASRQQIPARPEVSISNFEYRVDNSFIVGPPSLDGYRFDVEFELKDDPDRRNYYNLTVYEVFNGWTPKVFSSAEVALVSQFDDEILEGGQGIREDFHAFASFDDRLFNGKTKKIRIRIQHLFIPHGDTGDWALLRFELSAITKDLYEYHKAMREASVSVDVNNVRLPLTEPVRMFNNIEGGLGIFGAYSPRTFIWDHNSESFVHNNR